MDELGFVPFDWPGMGGNFHRNMHLLSQRYERRSTIVTTKGASYLSNAETIYEPVLRRCWRVLTIRTENQKKGAESNKKPSLLPPRGEEERGVARPGYPLYICMGWVKN